MDPATDRPIDWQPVEVSTRKIEDDPYVASDVTILRSGSIYHCDRCLILGHYATESAMSMLEHLADHRGRYHCVGAKLQAQLEREAGILQP